MARLVEQKGGIQACQENDKVLRELNDLENKSGAAHLQQGPTSTKGAASTSGLDDLKDELMTDVDAAIQKNLTVFSRKLEVQTRQIIDELSKVVERQGNRVISAIAAGPHDRIVDADVHKPTDDPDFYPRSGKRWRVSLGWAGEAASSRDISLWLYATTIKEAEQTLPQKRNNPTKMTGHWLTLMFRGLQLISEAFDDDASGFVTADCAENTFTASRPLDWSLKKWLAFWAIGWHQSMARYAVKIQELLAKMFALRLHVLPANRGSVNKYLNSIYNGVTTLHSGLNACYINESLQEKFHSYVEAEEAQPRGNLEAISYDIDALNTLYLISGQGRGRVLPQREQGGEMDLVLCAESDRGAARIDSGVTQPLPSTPIDPPTISVVVHANLSPLGGTEGTKHMLTSHTHGAPPSPPTPLPSPSSPPQSISRALHSLPLPSHPLPPVRLSSLPYFPTSISLPPPSRPMSLFIFPGTEQRKYRKHTQRMHTPRTHRRALQEAEQLACALTEECATRLAEEDLVPALELDVHAGVVNAFLWGEKGVSMCKKTGRDGRKGVWEVTRSTKCAAHLLWSLPHGGHAMINDNYICILTLDPMHFLLYITPNPSDFDRVRTG
ncbi:hypothetical protein B0H14DRAFT_3618757 [Mycena olivaceomarginata]|nr:hypothetical protein B0H14DRAFT_3618757 [Mycena olivaceomarginata]